MGVMGVPACGACMSLALERHWHLHGHMAHFAKCALRTRTCAWSACHTLPLTGSSLEEECRHACTHTHSQAQRQQKPSHSQAHHWRRNAHMHARTHTHRPNRPTHRLTPSPRHPGVTGDGLVLLCTGWCAVVYGLVFLLRVVVTF